ncbi:MAG: diversity-generating retroelement protein Avd [Planctomycetes bacterium]|nr:diversity-generating retroelement protein Avd [Planctomycetota bacterium]
MKEELPLFTHWYDTLVWMFKTAQRFPKSQRLTLTIRFLNLGLEVMEKIQALRYTKNREPLFRRTNLALDRLRVLSRILTELRILSLKQYEFFSMNVDEAGRMIGGWKRAVSGGSLAPSMQEGSRS